MKVKIDIKSDLSIITHLKMIYQPIYIYKIPACILIPSLVKPSNNLWKPSIADLDDSFFLS